MGLWTLIKNLMDDLVDKIPEVKLPEPTPPWMPIAESQLGVTEIPGRRHNNTILDYHRETSLKASSDEVPWCSSFVNWVLEQSGIEGTNSARARSWEDWGIELEEPSEGAIVVLSRGKNPSLGHVGFFVSQSPDGRKISILGGNQSDSVSIATFPKSRVVSYHYPEGY